MGSCCGWDTGGPFSLGNTIRKPWWTGKATPAQKITLAFSLYPLPFSDVMSRNWTPESRVFVTDAGMVIEIKLSAIQASRVELFVEADQLCVRGRHDDFGPFEARFDIAPNHNPAAARASFMKGILRIEVPLKDKSSGPREIRMLTPESYLAAFLKEPHEMMIYCSGCGGYFDIVVTGKGPKDYRCPACGKVQAFDLEALANKAMEQGKNMLKKRRGRR
jgi:HSP20 family molecular chaperone IbpA